MDDYILENYFVESTLRELRFVLLKVDMDPSGNRQEVEEKIRSLYENKVLILQGDQMVPGQRKIEKVTDPKIQSYITPVPTDLPMNGDVTLFDVVIHFGNDTTPSIIYEANRASTELICKYVDPNRLSIEQVASELNVFLLDHPNIIHYSYAFECPSGYFFIMDKYESDLEMAIDPYENDLYPNRNEEGLLSDELVTSLFSQMWKAIDYIHRHKIAHHDIKLANFFVKGDQLVLADFGLSSRWESEDPPIVDFYCGTRETMSPEIYGESPHLITAPDVWALGVCLFELLTGNKPYARYLESFFSGKEIAENFMTSKYTIYSTRPHYMKDLCYAFMEPDWKKRIPVHFATNYGWVFHPR
jgi:serine/threonine protein kinase